MIENLKGSAKIKRDLGERVGLTVEGLKKINDVIDIIRKFGGSLESVEPIRLTLEELFLSEIKRDKKL